MLMEGIINKHTQSPDITECFEENNAGYSRTLKRYGSSRYLDSEALSLTQCFPQSTRS